jgi:hypothetical protein
MTADEDSAVDAAAPVFGLEATVTMFGQACKAGMEAMPPVEKRTESRNYSTSERTRDVIRRRQLREGELAKQRGGNRKKTQKILSRIWACYTTFSSIKKKIRKKYMGM